MENIVSFQFALKHDLKPASFNAMAQKHQTQNDWSNFSHELCHQCCQPSCGANPINPAKVYCFNMLNCGIGLS